MDEKRIKTIKGQVEKILQEVSEARNSDVVLTQHVWLTFYPQFIHRNAKDQPAIMLADLRDLPSQDSLKRIRAHFQNDLKKYPPTTLKIALTRGFNEQEWRAALGYGRERLIDQDK